MRYGIIIGIIVGLFGCGSVEPSLTPDAGGDGMAVVDGSAGRSGGAGASMAGRGGTTGTAGQAGTGVAGSGGAPLKPLGTTCSANSECAAPGICAASADGGTACCDGHPDACNKCVGGHLQSVPDGTLCGTQPTGITCTGPYTTVNGPVDIYLSMQAMVCTAGACSLTTVSCAPLSCPSGQKPECIVDFVAGGAPRMEGTGCGCWAL
jgi:hypothetical protein